jgi:hypothetical protein
VYKKLCSLKHYLSYTAKRKSSECCKIIASYLLILNHNSSHTISQHTNYIMSASGTCPTSGDPAPLPSQTSETQAHEKAQQLVDIYSMHDDTLISFITFPSLDESNLSYSNRPRTHPSRKHLQNLSLAWVRSSFLRNLAVSNLRSFLCLWRIDTKRYLRV